MKSTFASLLALSLAVAAPAALAHQAVSPSASAAAPAGQKQVAKVPRPDDHFCLRSTGSRIPAKPGGCLPVAGRSYSGEDIRRTGARNTADALRMLDPAIH